MKILVTGDKGYLGSEFKKRYRNDYEIVGYDLANSLDLLNYKALTEKVAGCGMVVHLAGIPKPVEGRDFTDYFKNNVEASLNVFRAALEAGTGRVFMQVQQLSMELKAAFHFKSLLQKTSRSYLST